MKKISRKGLVKKLDTIVREILMQRQGKCVVCGSVNQLGVGHIFSRKAYSTRWDVTKDGNCNIQCWPCNYRHVRDQYPYFEWYINTFGKGSFDNLRVRFKTSVKYTTPQLEDLYEHLRKEYL